MSTTYTIPNRPVGSAVRNIGDIISDFDAVLAALNNFDGGNVQPGTISGEKLSDSVGQATGVSSLTDTRRGKSLVTAGATSGFAPTTWQTAPNPCKVSNLKVPSSGLLRVAARCRVFKSSGPVGASIAVGLGIVPTGTVVPYPALAVDYRTSPQTYMTAAMLGDVNTLSNAVAYTSLGSSTGWSSSASSSSGDYHQFGDSVQVGHMGELLIPVPAGSYDVGLIYIQPAGSGSYGVSGQELYTKVEA
jgi:hypothetical protein